MKVLKLTSDYPDFKTIKFNPKGLSFITGKEKIQSETSTYNGVGKTLALVLIDFCLGSEALKDLEKLNCNVHLDIEIDNVNYKISRHTVDENVININGEENTLEEYRKKLEKLLKIEVQKDITLRGILPYFIRYRKSSFVNPLMTQQYSKSNKVDYKTLIKVFYLLGLELDLVRKKYQNNIKLENAKMAKKALEDEEIKALLISSTTNINIEFDILNRKIEEKIKLREEYSLSENYNDLILELHKKREKLNGTCNRITIINSNIIKIEKSLQEKPDIGIKEIKNYYGEIIDIFPKEILQELGEVEKFYENMLSNRFSRLKTRKNNYLEELEFLNPQKVELEERVDALYQIVGSNGELVEYDTLNKEIENLQNRMYKYQNYKSNIQLIKNQISKCKQNIIDNNVLAGEYLIEKKKYIDELNKSFADLVVDLYGSELSGSIVIDNNERKNQIQFEVLPKMKNDSSTGIGHAKILCFTTLLLIRRVINIDCIIFDNKAFEGIASNQLANYFKTINNSDEYQYIFTINQNELNEMKQKLGDEFKDIITNNVVMNLTDDGDKGKLLGTTVEMDLKEN